MILQMWGTKTTMSKLNNFDYCPMFPITLTEKRWAFDQIKMRTQRSITKIQINPNIQNIVPKKAIWDMRGCYGFPKHSLPFYSYSHPQRRLVWCTTFAIWGVFSFLFIPTSRRTGVRRTLCHLRSCCGFPTTGEGWSTSPRLNSQLGVCSSR